MYAPQQVSPPPHPPPPGANSVTYVGAAREMKFPSGKVYDYDFSYASLGVDYVPFDRMFLLGDIQVTTAFLMQNQRDCLAIIHNPVAYAGHISLNFDHAPRGEYAGLPLVACQRDVFTVRILSRNKPGCLIIEGMDYHQPHVTDRMQAAPFAFNVHWAGSPCATAACLRSSKLWTTAMYSWTPPVESAQSPSQSPSDPTPQEEYDPTSPAMRTEYGDDL